MASAALIDKHIQETGLKAVKIGGAVLKEHYGDSQNITYKGKLDLVTDTDRKTEDAIVKFLNRECPDHGILTEEQQEIAGSAPYRWILDPLDGTTNYAHGYPFFCVSLACEQNGTVIWGTVYDPLRNECFTAAKGCGALLNGHPIQVSTTGDIDRALLCTGFPYDVHECSENNLDHFTRFIKSARAIRRDGAAALDLCYVAAGRFDGFWELKLKPWDIAAGCLIVAEAGGRVTDYAGRPCGLTQGEVIASNALLHESMVKIIQQDGETLP